MAINPPPARAVLGWILTKPAAGAFRRNAVSHATAGAATATMASELLCEE